jgi:hypothetical protein
VIEHLKAIAEACGAASLGSSPDNPARTVVSMLTGRGVYVVAERGGHARANVTVEWAKLAGWADGGTQGETVVGLVTARVDEIYNRSKGGK